MQPLQDFVVDLYQPRASYTHAHTHAFTHIHMFVGSPSEQGSAVQMPGQSEASLREDACAHAQGPTGTCTCTCTHARSPLSKLLFVLPGQSPGVHFIAYEWFRNFSETTGPA